MSTVTIYRDLDDLWQLADQLTIRAEVALAAGDLLSASLDVAESAALSLKIGEEFGLSRAVLALGHYADAAGHNDIAQQLAASYYAFADRFGNDARRTYVRLLRPDLASIVAASSLTESCRAALAELFG